MPKPPLEESVTYHYDSEGNLIGAVRRGRKGKRSHQAPQTDPPLANPYSLR
jgi:hypothetical protein